MQRIDIPAHAEVAVQSLGDKMPQGTFDLLGDSASVVEGVFELHCGALMAPDVFDGPRLCLIAVLEVGIDAGVAHRRLQEEVGARVTNVDSFHLWLLYERDLRIELLRKSGLRIYQRQRAGDLSQLVIEHGAASLDKQHAFRDFIGEHDWDLDLPKGTITFTTGGFLKKRRSYLCQVLGRESKSANAWLWAWDDPALRVPKRLLRAGHAMRRRGDKDRIAALTSSRQSLGRVSGHTFGMVASGILDAAFYYRAVAEDGPVFLLVTDKAYERLAFPPAERLLDIFPQASQSIGFEDHKAAFVAYAKYLGLTVHDQGVYVRVTHAGSAPITARFDAQRRLVELASA